MQEVVGSTPILSTNPILKQDGIFLCTSYSILIVEHYATIKSSLAFYAFSLQLIKNHIQKSICLVYLQLTTLKQFAMMFKKNCGIHFTPLLLLLIVNAGAQPVTISIETKDNALVLQTDKDNHLWNIHFGKKMTNAVEYA